MISAIFCRFLKLSKFSEDCPFSSGQDEDQDNFARNYEGLSKCIFHLVESFGTLRLLAMDLSDEDSV